MLQQRISSKAALTRMNYQSGLSIQDRIRQISQLVVPPTTSIAPISNLSDSDQLNTSVSIPSTAPQYDCSNEEDFTTLDPIDRVTCIFLYEHTNHNVMNGTLHPTCYNIDSIEAFIESNVRRIRLSNGLFMRVSEFNRILELYQLPWRHFQTKASGSEDMTITEYVPRNVPINSSEQYPNDTITILHNGTEFTNINRNELIQSIYQQLPTYDSSNTLQLPLIGNASIRNKRPNANIESTNTSIDMLSKSNVTHFRISRLAIRPL